MPPLTAPSSTARSGRWLASPITNAPVGVDSYIAGKHRGAASPAASPINGGGGSGLTGGFEISSVMVGHIFSLHPKQLALDRCRFAAGAFEALAQEVARSTTLTALSIAGCTGVPASSSIGSEVLHLLWNALLENTTLEALDVSNVQLTENDANFLADNVIPWNRSIVEWNLSGNPDLSDGGVTRIIGALVSAASSVERINLRRCGMGMDGLINVLLELRSLTSLQQLDVAMNGGYHQPQVMDVMREVDEILHRNCKLMHPSGSLSHTALYDATAVEMREQSEGGGFSEFTSIGADVLAFSASNVAGLGNPIKRRESIRLQQMPSPAAKQLERRSSLLLRSPDKHSAAGSGGSAPSPTMRSSASFRNGPRHTVAGTSNGAIAAAAAASQAHQQTVQAAAAAAAASAVATKLPLEAPTAGGGAEVSGLVDLSGISSVGRSNSGEQPHKKQHVDPQVGGTTGVVRRSSVATMPQSTPPSAIKRAASPRQQQSPSEIQQSSRLRHDPVNDGADNWLKVKEHYNSYIRSGASAAAAEAGGADSPARASSALRKAALETPKYVLGKLVSKVKSGQPSSSFHPSANGTVMYVREPMPAERRKYAPWNQNGINAAHVFESPSRRSGTPTRSGQDGAVSASSVATNIPSSYVGKRIIVMDAKSDPRHQTAIRIVDGGDITMIQDDPRDIGYASRNIQKSGGAGVRPSAGFASNTEREVRWGTDASNQLARTAQAPPPGTYTVLSPFDASVRKAQAASRSTTATGKKCFGSSGSSRSTNVVVENNVPGPGFYEIP